MVGLHPQDRDGAATSSGWLLDERPRSPALTAHLDAKINRQTYIPACLIPPSMANQADLVLIRNY
ncbi:MAG: hypothetical protein KME35_11420 [Aphanocapsa sp. GSE-SYN-MK-11-07L]|jgi:hypothetical protein|nr:hypothetical protein [Aphanocapsa sp. GSE-SYN-MK-11-07L]